MDKLKDHLDRKHPEIEVERWYYGWRQTGGRSDEVTHYRDVTKRAEHEVDMLSKGFKPMFEGSILFVRK